MNARLVHLLIVDADGLARTRRCGAVDGHVNYATPVLRLVTCADCVSSHYFGRRRG